MAIFQEILSMDDYFKSVTTDKIIINDLNYFDIQNQKTLQNSLMTIYDNSDIISTIPSCDCKNLKGRYYLNITCDKCNTKVKEAHEKLEPVLWLKSISNNKQGQEQYHFPFLSPMFWLMLSDFLDKNVDYLRYLTDSMYNPPIEIPPIIQLIKIEILKDNRDYLNFINNIENILEYLMASPKYKYKDKQTKLFNMLELYRNNKSKLLSNYMPIVNKKLFVVEETNRGKFINLVSSGILDVVTLWLKTTSDNSLSYKKLSSVMGIISSGLSRLYYDHFDKYLTHKRGILRKHVYGAKSHFTFRCVIVSRPKAHNYDDLEVPWVVGLTAFRPHVINKLMARGYNYKEANRICNVSIKKYSKEMEDILDELVKDNRYNGIPIIFSRNPGLKQGSCLNLRITKFKPDVNDFTVNISQLVIKIPNGDYDGI